MMLFKLTVLTPVHIGNGKVLSALGDYIHDGQNLYRIDHRKLEKKIAELDNFEEILEQFVKIIKRQAANAEEKYTLSDFLAEHGIDPVSVSNLIIEDVDEVTNEIRETVKNGIFPYIPGSSLKGAIRTTLLRHHYKDGFRITYREKTTRYGKKYLDYYDIEKGVFNQYADDVLKYLHCADSRSFEKTQLAILKTQVRYLIEEGKKGTDLYYEAIRPEAVSYIDVKTKADQDSPFNGKKKRYLFKSKELDLFKIVNEISVSRLEAERKNILNQEGHSYDALRPIFNRIKEAATAVEGKGAIMRIGGGKTFYDQSVADLSNNQEKAMQDIIYYEFTRNRNKKSQDDIVVDEFPSTRKFVVKGEANIYNLMGWIKLERTADF